MSLIQCLDVLSRQLLYCDCGVPASLTRAGIVLLVHYLGRPTTPEAVAEWLERNNLGNFAPAFVRDQINGKQLVLMNAGHLLKYNMSALQQEALLKSIQSEDWN